MWWVWTQRPPLVLWCGCPIACFSLCGHVLCRSGLWPKFHSILLPLVSLPLSHCYMNPFFTMAPCPWLDTITFPGVDLERCCLWRRHLPPPGAPQLPRNCPHQDWQLGTSRRNPRPSVGGPLLTSRSPAFLELHPPGSVPVPQAMLLVAAA